MSSDSDHRDYDFNRLRDAISKQPRPPCDACLWSRECTDPDACTPFKFYVDTGREIRPPRELPASRSAPAPALPPRDARGQRGIPDEVALALGQFQREMEEGKND